MINGNELNVIRLNAIMNDAITNDSKSTLEIENAKYLKSIADAKIFCETQINDELINVAKSTYCDDISIKIDCEISEDIFGHKYISPLYEEYQTYANGDKSYNVDNSIRYDLQTLIEYLNKNNIHIDIKNSYYCHYGRGLIECKQLIFYTKMF